MDCCSKYPDYRHHPMGGGVLGNGGGGPLNGSYYSHAHPSIRYQQSMYRLTAPGGFNGIGPPTAAAPPSAPPNLYPNYDRYSSYSNLPLYAYNANGFSYGNLGARDVSGYYGHYDGIASRGAGFPYHNYRGLYEPGAAGPRGGGGGYQMYAHPGPGRDFHPGSAVGNGYHPHSGTGHHHLHHHHPHQHNATTKDSFISQLSDIRPASRSDSGGGGVCTAAANDGSSLNPEIAATAARSPLGSGPTSSCSSSVIGSGLGHSSDLTSFGTGYQRNASVSEGARASEQQQSMQQISPEIQQISTGFPYGLKESKPRKAAKDKEKTFGRLSAASNRRVECSTPLDTSPAIERSATPFIHSSNGFPNSPNSLPSRIQNGYLSSSQSNGNWSPYSNSPNSWTQQHSPRPLSKRVHSPRPQASPMPVTSTNKSRVLECDFIPSKRKKKISSDESDDPYEFREEIKNITPLPGFQQAFGSTEIGKFSETFFNTPESPYEHMHGSEADTLSPQPWETGDSLEGPHFNLHIGASVQPVYSENQNPTDSPLDGNYFSEIRCSDY